MTRLPDEAVEAMARAAWDAPVPRPAGGPYGRLVPWSDLTDIVRQQEFARSRAALAALPAGVYRSDGQGNVEPVDESVAAAALFEFAREECGWGSHEWDLCQQMTGVVLTALSATDTETSR